MGLPHISPSFASASHQLCNGIARPQMPQKLRAINHSFTTSARTTVNLLGAFAANEGGR
jgi:hypothetical protein